MSVIRWLSLGAAVLLIGCGSRGDPMEPLRPAPPAIPDLRVSQRGVTAILNFPVPQRQFVFANATFEIETIELLMAAERFPAITAEMLAVTIDRERVTRMREARTAARRARDQEEQRRLQELLRIATEEALAAGQEPPTLESLGLVDPDAEEDSQDDDDDEVPLTEDEILLRRVPRNYQQAWRESEVRPEMLLDAARRLDRAVDLLWDELELPAAVVDLSEPPALPPPDELIRTADRVARAIDYTGYLDATTFLERASVIETVPFDDLELNPSGSRAILRHGIGIPSPGPTRTRYYFAVRIVAAEKYFGGIGSVAAVAPDVTPVAPPAVDATVTPRGVLVRWLPAPGDVWGELLEPDQVQYNVYRQRLSGEPASTLDTPLNSIPLKTTTYTDSAMPWGERYTYEVRPLNAPILSPDQAVDLVEGNVSPPPQPEGGGPLPRKEGAGRTTAPVLVVDEFPPPPVGGLEATRAADRVTLRWRTPPSNSVAGFRVFRHREPAPALPALDAEATSTDADDPAAGAATTDTEPTAAEIDSAAAADRRASEAEETPADTEAAADPDAADADSGSRTVGPWQLCPPPPPPPGSAARLPPLVPDRAPAPPPTEPESTGGRRRRLNTLVRAGWELLTPTLGTQLLYIDPVASTADAWVYLVAAVDGAGNGGPFACVRVPAEESGQ